MFGILFGLCTSFSVIYTSLPIFVVLHKPSLFSYGFVYSYFNCYCYCYCYCVGCLYNNITMNIKRLS
ncbi:hypothetical protein J3Q64DRAFT_1744318 [Phycomyces blakesleeanus]|uniref:Uncharacterized protein n=1 Tax=Phycomyces blakesleeanus TaxID=4837 RepID=A0ABR3B0F8_PHYBL